MAEYLIQEETLVRMADILRENAEYENAIRALINNVSTLTSPTFPKGITSISEYRFAWASSLTRVSVPEEVDNIAEYAFMYCRSLTNVTFKGTPTRIAPTVFTGCDNLATINVPWAVGEVANAPWGATNATINYNYVER